MDDLSIEELRYGFNQVLKTCEDLPAPATVRKLIEERNVDEREDQAEEDLRRLDRLIGEWGCDRTPEWRGGKLQQAPQLTGALAYALQAVGGWRTYAMADEREAKFLRKDFLMAHKRYGARKKQDNRITGGPESALGQAMRQLGETKSIQ